MSDPADPADLAKPPISALDGDAAAVRAPAGPPGVELYRSANLIVRAAGGAARDACVVTFDHYGTDRDLDRPGFGEKFLASRGMDAVTVRGRGDHWYQYPDMTDALAAIAHYVAPYRRVITYGSSMGGYAAWRFADAIGAHGCIALSPQYSIARRKVPFEERWAQEAGAFDWTGEDDRTSADGCVPVVVYDRRDPDCRHAALIAKNRPIVDVPLPCGGHPVSTFLASAGLLEPLIAAVLDGSLDAAAFRREAMARRRGDPAHLLELARRLPARRRPLAIALARRAVAAVPDSAYALHVVAQLLTAAGLHDEALVLHRRATELTPALIEYRLRYSVALEAAGDVPGATAIAEGIVNSHPDKAYLVAWLAHLCWASGDKRRALAYAERAMNLSPSEPHYADRLAHYRRRRSLRAQAWRWLARVTLRTRQRLARTSDSP